MENPMVQLNLPLRKELTNKQHVEAVRQAKEGVTKEAIRHRLFLLFLMGEATLWLKKLSDEFITTWGISEPTPKGLTKTLGVKVREIKGQNYYGNNNYNLLGMERDQVENWLVTNASRDAKMENLLNRVLKNIYSTEPDVKEMHGELSTLSQLVDSHSTSIKQLENKWDRSP
ncbi:hypothetical protein HAX54_026584 [Datura stramonium]|uniref:Uncharacterized protein n=1 Tax=Datura stramonium TaxID=4076 RepID=A0ABS8V171_DATST|nr:hypothetical protein [Datura stramonium]